MIYLETERMILRPLLASDAEELFQIQCKADTMRFLGGKSVSTEKIRALITQNAPKQSGTGLGMRAAILKSSGKLVGRCGLFASEVDGDTEIELAYLIDVDSASRGLATEAARILTDHASKDLDLKRIVALIHPANLASIRVAEKIGFQFERLRSEASEFGVTSIYSVSFSSGNL
jgi:[ribosomal protein S5]-alanine N-acetyltransferase